MILFFPAFVDFGSLTRPCCQVWAQSGAGELENFQMAKMEFTDHRGK